MRLITTILAMLFIIPFAGAQQVLKGKIYDKETDSLLVSTTVYNATRKAYALSSKDGDYSIVANEGDRIVFSSSGYLADTVKVLNYMIDAGFDVTMRLRYTVLKGVTVRSASYQQDSLKQREDYNAFYNRPKKNFVSKSGPQDGVGIAISPIGFLHNKSSDRKMKKNLEYQDEQDYVDYSFSRRYVEKLTGLHGDSLMTFMLRYRPTYQFCRSASTEDMFNYVNDKYKTYMNREDPADKKKKKHKKKDD